jgi:hypothetical protein
VRQVIDPAREITRERQDSVVRTAIRVAKCIGRTNQIDPDRVEPVGLPIRKVRVRIVRRDIHHQRLWRVARDQKWQAIHAGQITAILASCNIVDRRGSARRHCHTRHQQTNPTNLHGTCTIQQLFADCQIVT